MNESIEEGYPKDGKPLLELVQEWIDENYIKLCCISNEKNLQYNSR